MHFQDLPPVLRLKKLAGGAWVMKNLLKGAVFFETTELVQYNQSQEIFRKWETGELIVYQAIEEMLSIPIVRHALGALQQIDHTLSREEYFAYYGKDEMESSLASGLRNQEAIGMRRKQPSDDLGDRENREDIFTSKRPKPM
jgi:hypothetical protein